MASKTRRGSLCGREVEEGRKEERNESWAARGSKKDEHAWLPFYHCLILAICLENKGGRRRHCSIRCRPKRPYCPPNVVTVGSPGSCRVPRQSIVPKMVILLTKRPKSPSNHANFKATLLFQNAKL